MTLSPRERACLARSAEGKSLKVIAIELGIEPGTVSSYLRDAKTKLGARSPRHAALMYSDWMRRPLFTGGSEQGIDPLTIHTSSLSAVEITEVNDVMLDRGIRGSNDASWSRVTREILDGARPSDLSIYARSLLILVTTVVIGAIFFALTVGLALLAAPMMWVRSFFP